MSNKRKNVSAQSIKVYCRLKQIIRKEDFIQYDIKKGELETSDVLLLKCPKDQLSKNTKSQFKFLYDGIFDENESQRAIYDRVASPIVNKFTRGFNGTVFTYGQTGSGKTYTINGASNDEGKGIMPRSFQEVFDIMTSKSKEELKTYDLSFSYIEIYDEVVYDLLKPTSDTRIVNYVNKKKSLENLKNTVSIHTDNKGLVSFQNLTIHTVKNVSEIMKLLKKGDSRRKLAPTSMNIQSSLSHCICTIYLTQQNNNSSRIYTSKLNLVDLAGFERTFKSKVAKKTFSEARYINLSLHYLKEVITIKSNSANKKYVPYRNSMTTSVLRDTLSDNCFTAIIANVVLNPLCIMETLSTCRFAQKITTLKNHVAENWNPTPSKKLLLLPKENELLKLKNKKKCEYCWKQNIAISNSGPQNEERPLRLNGCGDGNFVTAGNTELNNGYGEEIHCEPRARRDLLANTVDITSVADTEGTPFQPSCGYHFHLFWNEIFNCLSNFMKLSVKTANTGSQPCKKCTYMQHFLHSFKD